MTGHTPHGDNDRPEPSTGVPAQQDHSARSADRPSLPAAVRALFGADLLGPSPGILPFGRRARARRAEWDRLRQEAQDRRATLGRSREARWRGLAGQPGWRPVSRRRNLAVIAALCSAVAVVMIAAWWLAPSPPAPRTTKAAPTDSTEATTARSTERSLTTSATASAQAQGVPEGEESGPYPIPPNGVAPVTPAPRVTGAPGDVVVATAPTHFAGPDDLASPQSAAVAWLARVCSFDHRDPFGAAEARGRSAMTEAQWVHENPTQYEPARRSWQRTVIAGEVGRCSEPTASVSPEAPRTDDQAIVLISADRVVSASSGAVYVERADETRVVERGTDGLWRVGQRTSGG